MIFDWDRNKNLSNVQKHNVTFEEASTVFDDVEAIVIKDELHTIYEERFIILGLSRYANMLVVCHCFRSSEELIRIISARKATKNEERQYYCRKELGW